MLQLVSLKQQTHLPFGMFDMKDKKYNRYILVLKVIGFFHLPKKKKKGREREKIIVIGFSKIKQIFNQDF